MDAVYSVLLFIGSWFPEIVMLLGVLSVLVGALLYVLLSPRAHFGMGQQCEQEGDLQAAMRHYRLAMRYGAGRMEGRVAQTRLSELAARSAQEPRSDGC